MYNVPGVYISDKQNGVNFNFENSSSVGAMIGVTRSGILNIPQKVSSWTEFINKFANGLDTPFSENLYLPYSVYGFFANGGKELYIVSIKGKGAKKATNTSGPYVFTAKNEGEWGNELSYSISKTSEDIFSVTVSLGNESVTLKNVTFETFVKSLESNRKIKEWVDVELKEATKLIEIETQQLSGGSDGETLTDSEYVDALSYLDTLTGVTLVSIPAQTSTTITNKLLEYCGENNLFPLLDVPLGTSVADVITFRKSIDAWTGEVAYPWGKVNDPLTGTLKTVPSSGHLMGLYARTIESRGVFKAPAGVEAVVKGFVDLEYHLTSNEISELNPVGVVCICARPNIGIVVWGARSLNSSDNTMRYVSDGLLNLHIKRNLYNNTQFAVFEPNNEKLWQSLRTVCLNFLEDLRIQGAFKGNSPEECYYVTVDSTNNTSDTIDEGQVNIEIGYAPVKPAEFVIIKLAHSLI